MIDDRDEIRAYRQACLIAERMLGNNPADLLREIKELLDFIEAHIDMVISKAQALSDGKGHNFPKDGKCPGGRGGK